MEPTKVPNVLSSIQDIILYHYAHVPTKGPIMKATNLCGSSLNGRRLISEFFFILDYHILLSPDGDYKLQKLDDDLRVGTSPPIERSSPGKIVAGNYLIDSISEIKFKQPLTFFDSIPKHAATIAKHAAAIAKLAGGSAASERSTKDRPDDGQSFKMRLVYRDKGCVVCLASGIQDFYLYFEDSNRFEGGYIIPFAFNELWNVRGYSALVKDPFTDPVHANKEFASPTTRSNTDPRRINSADNGILLCLNHHKDFEHLRFAIHPFTHCIYSFHPATTTLHGVEVKAPWLCKDPRYPPPHTTFLYLHFSTCIWKALHGDAESAPDVEELDDNDEDDSEEISDLEEVSNRDERVRIWLDSSSTSGMITSPLDLLGENKDNFETLTEMQEVITI